MGNRPFFSIVIPVYKNVDFLKRLLDSIVDQKFKDYEVVITDDSPDNSIEEWLRGNYRFDFLIYHRNEVALGTPENWNEGVRRSNGTWIKIMHDDDWFACKNALESFYEHIQRTPSARFFYSAYSNFFFESNSLIEVRSPWFRRKLLASSPHILYARNIIGPPSVTLVHSSIAALYDRRMKWLVDIDYYISLLKNHSASYLDRPLVNVGIGKEQVTTGCHTVAEVEIPEGLLLLSKLREKSWLNVLYFDAWWRIIRNLGIREISQFKQFSGDLQVPEFIHSIILSQSRLSSRWLKNGYFSKLMMLRCWSVCLFR